MIELRSSHLVVSVDTDRGAEITHLGRTDAENVLAWGDDWVGPLPAERSRSYGSDELDWLSGYRLGWQEMFPNAGSGCTVMDVPLPFHGEASMARWEVLETTPTRLVVRTPTRLPLVLERTMTLASDRAALRLEERIHNESDMDVPCIWGHHPAFVVSAASLLDIPAREVIAAPTYLQGTDLQPGATGTWPYVGGADGSDVDLRQPMLPRRFQRLSYLPDVVDGWAAIRDTASGVGAGLAWDAATFPHLWLWQDSGTDRFPFFGRARLTALEPSRAWPGDGLIGAIERGQALVVSGGATHTTWLTAVVFDATERVVTGIDRHGAVRTGA